MKINTILLISLILSIFLGGCTKFLTVEPKSNVGEDKMFSSQESFQQALNGVYAQLASANMYGDLLSMGFVSALAQNYAVDWDGAPYNQTRKFNYNSQEVIDHLRLIWENGYNALAGVNKIISNCKDRRSVLSDENYGLIYGETLGLRALIHFDLLRLYGPEYTTGALEKSIPYKTNTIPKNTPPETTEKIIDYVLADLEEAAAAMKVYDQLDLTTRITRRVKMNYLAVRALEARVRLYKGDKIGAFTAAKEVVDSKVFTFVTPSAAGAVIGSRDRIYVNEQVFALRSTLMRSWVDSYFRYNINIAAKLTRPAEEIADLYDNSPTDIRYLYSFDDSDGRKFPSKFWQDYTLPSGASSTSINRLDQLVPVIRLSEMYYILAETADTPAEGYGFLNEVRLRRAIEVAPLPNITREILENEITKEYQKEFFGEGQLFFYYKRKKTSRMRFMNKDVQQSIYRLPIPEGELEYNPNY